MKKGFFCGFDFSLWAIPRDIQDIISDNSQGIIGMQGIKSRPWARQMPYLLYYCLGRTKEFLLEKDWRDVKEEKYMFKREHRLVKKKKTYDHFY